MGFQVLLIEDDVEVTNSLVDLLALEGFSARCSQNGVDALHLLSCGDLPQVILVDNMMPLMNGVEFRRAQLNDPRLALIPTYMISGGAVPVDPVLMFSGELRKPMQICELIELVAKHCSSPLK